MGKNSVSITITKKKIKTVLVCNAARTSKLKELNGLKDVPKKNEANCSLWDKIINYIADKSPDKKDKKEGKEGKEEIKNKIQALKLNSNDYNALPELDLIILVLILIYFLNTNQSVVTLTGESYAESLVSSLRGCYSPTGLNIPDLQNALRSKKKKVTAKLKSLGIIKTLTLKEKFRAKRTDPSDLITAFCRNYSTTDKCTKSAAKDALDKLADLRLRLHGKSNLTDCESLAKNLTELLNNQACTFTNISNESVKSVLNNFKEADWVKNYEQGLLKEFCDYYKALENCYAKALSAMNQLEELKKHLNSKQNLSDCNNLYNCLNNLYNWHPLTAVDITHEGLSKVLNSFQNAYNQTNYC